MPAAFAEVIAMTDVEAEATMGDVFTDMSADDAHAVLWPLVRRQAGLSPSDEAPSAWRAALDRLMALPRPDPSWGAQRGEASSAYVDDTHSGGWAVACLVNSLRRIALARDRATLHADPLKCKVLTSPALQSDLNVLLEPLRGGDRHRWDVVTRMRVLGVTLSDPTDRDQLEQAIRETLQVRSETRPIASSPSSRRAPSRRPPTSRSHASSSRTPCTTCRCGASSAGRACGRRSTTRSRDSVWRSARSTSASASQPRQHSARS